MMAAAVVAAMTLGKLLGPAAGLHADLKIRDLVIDHRHVTAGAAFVAVPGSRVHGVSFAEQALERGAAVVLYEPSGAEGQVPHGPSIPIAGLKARLGELARAFYGRGREPAELAGVTGTNGKTTVAHSIAQAMQRLGAPCGYIGTLGFGVPPDIEPHALTTPDCFTLHREIAAIATPHVALEVSSHALEQDRVAGLEFGTAIFTNLTRDHLDHHGDLASYGRAKMRLFTRPELRRAVVNRDDPFAAPLTSAMPSHVRVLGTSLAGAAEADLVARFVSRGLDGMVLEIGGAHGAAALDSRFIGRFNAENLLVALGALLAWELPLGDACAALAACEPPKGRMEIHGGDGAPYVVIDYAHTPDALERVLATLREACNGEIWCVFGCGGERDRGKRALMGRAAARHAEHVVLTDDNPRGEDPALIVADIREGLAAHPSVVVEHARDAAIARAIRGASALDVVLVAGKGHETAQIIGAGERPFDDREAVARALGRLG
jgi:UDP-N-acetylmuramoyl-L-alanyl-D-glutamate--2,6-diaminopimelate ligase